MKLFSTSSFLLVIFLSLAHVIGTQPAQAANCESYTEPQISIEQVNEVEQYSNDFNLKDMRKLAGSGNMESAALREMPVGLTIANLRLDSSFEVVAHPSAPGAPVCAQISTFNLLFGFKDTKVYVAQEIHPDTCGYNEVLEHERRHVAIDQEVIASYMPQLRDLVAGHLREIGVVHARTMEDAEAVLRQTINDYLKDLGISVASVREQHQRNFDNPAEYQRLSTVCEGEIAKLISRSM